jgi:hypothetical protein
LRVLGLITGGSGLTLFTWFSTLAGAGGIMVLYWIYCYLWRLFCKSSFFRLIESSFNLLAIGADNFCYAVVLVSPNRELLALKLWRWLDDKLVGVRSFFFSGTILGII